MGNKVVYMLCRDCIALLFILLSIGNSQDLNLFQGIQLDVYSSGSEYLYGEPIIVTIRCINNSTTKSLRLSKSDLSRSIMIFDSAGKKYSKRLIYDEKSAHLFLPGDTLQIAFDVIEQCGNAFEFESTKLWLIRFLPPSSYTAICRLNEQIYDSLRFDIKMPQHQYNKEALSLYLEFAQKFATSKKDNFKNISSLLLNNVFELITDYEKSPYAEVAARIFFRMSRNDNNNLKGKEQVFDTLFEKYSNSKYIYWYLDEEFKHYFKNYGIQPALYKLDERVHKAKNQRLKEAAGAIMRQYKNLK